MDSFDQYGKLLEHLGVLNRMETEWTKPGWNIGGDGFADADARKWSRWKSECTFKKSPIPFFKALTSLWLKGQDFGSSHLGHITSSKPLLPEDFEPRKQGGDEDDSLFVQDSSMEVDDNGNGTGASGGGEAMVID